jgi:hypothetical protein
MAIQMNSHWNYTLLLACNLLKTWSGEKKWCSVRFFATMREGLQKKRLWTFEPFELGK